VVTHDELIEKVAKAINGPFRSLPEGSPHTLEQLRDIRWTQINGMERNLCLASAKAAISNIYAALQEPTEAMKEAWDLDTGRWISEEIEDPYHPWRVMLAASCLSPSPERR